MNNTKLIFSTNNFITWCTKEYKLGEATSISYISYINRFFSEYEDVFITPEQFECMINNRDIDDILKGFNNMYNRANREINKLRGAKIKKTSLQNIKSALRKYQEYLIELAVNNTEENLTTAKNNLSNQNTSEVNQALLSVQEIILKNEDIVRNFTFRLITQDRPYGEVYFPISVLKKLFYKNHERDFFNNWIKQIINMIQIHVGKNNIIRLKDVDELMINKNGTVSIKCNDGLSKELYTKLADSDEVVKLFTKGFNKIVLDHIIPMKEILNHNIDQLLGLRKITKLMILLNGNQKLTNRKEITKMGNKLLDEGLLSISDIEQLKEELNIIASKTKLQLMDARENARKAANVMHELN